MQASQQNNESVFQFFKNMSVHLPLPLYWMDLDGVVRGANESGYKSFEFSSDVLMIGKTVFDLYPHQMAQDISRHNMETILAGQIYTQELNLVDEAGKNWSFNAMKIPLKDASGKIIGIAVSPNCVLGNADVIIKEPIITIDYSPASNDDCEYSFADLRAAESVASPYGVWSQDHHAENKIL